ncbi:MAG: efflux RND transporter periplasmic adaptor subunit [Bacteroidales bacterium]|nr:efflux RND transporter periplasmic adaptor subunit [Bacteroidales bacterium]
MKKILNWALAIGCGAMLMSCSGRKYGVTYETEQVTRGNVSTSVTATGTIEPVTEVEVGTQVSGIISHIYVDFNDEVKKGQIIAELDKSTLSARLASAQAQLASAKSDLQYKKKSLDRMKELHDKQYISDDEYEMAVLAYDQSKATFEAQQLSVDEAKTNLGYATITSPIDGVILSREVEEGQTVAASMTTPTLFIIAQDLTDMRVIADVDEADIGGVKEGQRVSFTVDAYPNDVFEGYVTQVRQEATTESNVVTYEVVISAPNPDLKLKPGLTASVNIFTLERNHVLTVSAKALRFVPKETMVEEGDSIVDCPGKTKLWVKEAHTVKAVPVEVGASNGVTTEILSGVEEGFVCISEAKIAQEASGDNAQQATSNPFMPGPPNSKKK